MKTISFIGNMGCGKSSWINQFEKLGYPVFREDLTQVHFLKDYWTTGQNAFHSQIGFYSSFLELFNSAKNAGGGFLDCSLFAIHKVFSKYMLDNGIVSQKEWMLFEQLHNAIEDVINCHHVFLHCEPSVNAQRANERSRQNELRNDAFVLELNKRFIEETANKFLTIDITNLNPENADDVQVVLDKLKNAGLLGETVPTTEFLPLRRWQSV